MLKLTYCLRRLPHFSRDEFQRYWRETHGPLVRERARALGIQRYLQLHTEGGDLDEVLRASRSGPEPFDGVAELWWESREALATALSTPEGRKASQELLDDERRFIDQARSPLWTGTEHVFVGES